MQTNNVFLFSVNPSLPATLSFSHRQLLSRRRRSLALTGDQSLPPLSDRAFEH